MRQLTMALIIFCAAGSAFAASQVCYKGEYQVVYGGDTYSFEFRQETAGAQATLISTAITPGAADIKPIKFNPDPSQDGAKCDCGHFTSEDGNTWAYIEYGQFHLGTNSQTSPISKEESCK